MIKLSPASENTVCSSVWGYSTTKCPHESCYSGVFCADHSKHWNVGFKNLYICLPLTNKHGLYTQSFTYFTVQYPWVNPFQIMSRFSVCLVQNIAIIYSVFIPYTCKYSLFYCIKKYSKISAPLFFSMLLGFPSFPFSPPP